MHGTKVLTVEILENGFLIRYWKLAEKLRPVNPMEKLIKGMGPMAAEGYKKLSEGEGWDPDKAVDLERLKKGVEEIQNVELEQKTYYWRTAATFCTDDTATSIALATAKAEQDRADKLEQAGFHVSGPGQTADFITTAPA